MNVNYKNNCFNHCHGITITNLLTSINKHTRTCSLLELLFISQIRFYVSLNILLHQGNRILFKLHYCYCCELLDYHHALNFPSTLKGKVSSEHEKLYCQHTPQINLHKTIPFHYFNTKPLPLLSCFAELQKRALLYAVDKFNPIRAT